jgi:hypothetical protein
VSVRRVRYHGGAVAVPARIRAHGERLTDACAHRTLGLAKSFAPVVTGRLRDSGGTERRGIGHWLCFFEATYAEPVELGHVIANQFGGPYGYVPPQPFLAPAHAITVGELDMRATLIWRGLP